MQTIDYSALQRLHKKQVNDEQYKALNGSYDPNQNRLTFGVAIIALVVLGLFAFVISKGFFIPAGMRQNVGAIVFYGGIVVVVLFVKFANRWYRKYDIALKNFASANGFSLFSGNPPVTPMGGYLQKYDSEAVSEGLRGILNGHEFWMYTYKYSVNFGVLEQDQISGTVLALTMPSPATLPRFMLISQGDLGQVGLKSVPGLEELRLEGDFSQHFRLLLESGSQDDVLSIVTPDVMQTMIDQGSFVNIDCTGEYIHFTMHGSATMYAQTRKLIEYSQYFMDLLDAKPFARLQQLKTTQTADT